MTKIERVILPLRLYHEAVCDALSEELKAPIENAYNKAKEMMMRNMEKENA